MENMKEITHSDIEAIIRRDEESGQMEENRKIVMSNACTKEELLAKNTPSESKLLANKADMPQSKATTMMKRIQKQRYADLSVQDLGVLNRLIKDYECSVDLYSIAFAGEDHPIFNRLIELANKYPNRRFIANAIRDKIDEKKEEIQMSIDTQKGNLFHLSTSFLLFSSLSIFFCTFSTVAPLNKFKALSPKSSIIFSSH